MKLYELINDYQEIIESEEFNEEVKGEILTTITEELQKKEGNLLHVSRNFKVEIETIDNEIKRLQAMKKSKQNAFDIYKGYVSDCLKKLGMEKVKNTFGTIYFTHTKSVQIDDSVDLSKLGEDYAKVTYTPNKTALKKALENGEVIDGISLKETESIVFK